MRPMPVISERISEGYCVILFANGRVMIFISIGFHKREICFPRPLSSQFAALFCLWYLKPPIIVHSKNFLSRRSFICPLAPGLFTAHGANKQHHSEYMRHERLILMQNVAPLTSQQAQKVEEIKRAIRQVRYEISVAAEAPDSLERLPVLYSQLTALYNKQEQEGARKTAPSKLASSN